MEFFRNITDVVLYETSSFSIPLFLLSLLLLIGGVALKAHFHAVRLSFLEHSPLNWIERTHPHLPSPRVIVTIALCSATLLLAGLQTIQNVFPFNDPYQGLNLASLFILGGALGVLAELKWKGAREYASAILAGTALAFLLMILQFSAPDKPLAEKVGLLFLLIPPVLLLGYTLSQKHQRSMLLTIMISFSFWILISIVQ
jgi:hypothetical protein